VLEIKGNTRETIKNNRWKLKNNTKGTQTTDWNLLNKIRKWKWRWNEEGTYLDEDLEEMDTPLGGDDPR